VTRTDELAREVAERFDLEYDSLDLDLPAPAGALAAVEGPKVEFERSSMSRFLGAFTAARLAVGGLVIAGAVGALLDMTLLGPIGGAVGLIAGRKLVGMERERQVEHRRQQARQELRRYVDEVSFVVGKDSRDAVRRAQRYLRDEFAARAALSERSSARALEVVREAAAVPAAQVPERVRELDARSRDLAALAESLTTPATTAPGGPR
jgi:hypothetical protein